MSYSKFTLAMKSTIDYHAKLLAAAAGIAYVDLDGEAMNADLLASDDAALAWSLTSMHEAPRDPLWQVEFEIGAKTSLDPATYASLDIISNILAQFPCNASIPIYDYSALSVGVVRIGTLIIGTAGVQPQQFDRTAGLRLVNVTAHAIRLQ